MKEDKIVRVKAMSALVDAVELRDHNMRRCYSLDKDEITERIKNISYCEKVVEDKINKIRNLHNDRWKDYWDFEVIFISLIFNRLFTHDLSEVEDSRDTQYILGSNYEVLLEEYLKSLQGGNLSKMVKVVEEDDHWSFEVLIKPSDIMKLVLESS